VWPDERVARFVNENFLPARVHVKDPGNAFKRYSQQFKAPWTPTILFLDPDGVEQHRIEGFLPPDDFLAQLMLGRAKLAFNRQQWGEAERLYQEVVSTLPNSDAAPEALYWLGATRYKKTGNPAALAETGQQFKQRYKDTTWAKKASVWA
jgi:hypothetical protein